MNPAMRVPILLVCAAISLNSARADALSDADRESLLENLEKLRESANAKVDARFRVALAAFREAIGSDDAAIELYLNCMEKVNFEDQQKKPADFREWKRKEAEKLSDPGLRLALRQQLRWLVLTLQAASEKADRAKLAVDAQEIVDSILRESGKLKNQQAILNQAVTSSVFARAYDIFRQGDESAAALRMLAHLEKHLSHPAARGWGEEFEAQLKPAVVVPPPESANQTN